MDIDAVEFLPTGSIKASELIDPVIVGKATRVNCLTHGFEEIILVELFQETEGSGPMKFSTILTQTFNFKCFVIVLFALGACATPGRILGKQTPRTEALSVSGKVIDTHNNLPIPDVKVSVLASTARTNKQGKFYLSLSHKEFSEKQWKDRFVVKLHKEGYLDTYDVIKAGQHLGQWQMKKGRTITFDPEKDIVLQSNPNALGEKCWTALGRVNWDGIEHLKVPLTLNGNGQWIDWSASDPLRSTLRVHEDPIPCNNNFSVFLPAQSLVDSNGRAPQGDVIATIGGISLVKAEEMPGDFGVTTNRGIAQMLSFGAGQFYVSNKELIYHLKKGHQAKVRIPVDPLVDAADAKVKLPESVPLLSFNETNGFWEPDGKLSYNKKGHWYEGVVRHFSVLNADQYKDEPAAIRVDVRPIAGTFNKISITFNDGGSNVVRELDIPPADLLHDYHLIINLPPYTDVHLQALFEGPGISQIASSPVVVNTGGSEAETLAQLSVYPYDLCDVTAILWKDDPPALAAASSTVTTAGPITLTASYDWASVPIPATDNDRMRFYHSATSQSTGFSEIAAVRVTPSEQEAPTTFSWSPVGFPSLFTLGNHWFRARADKGTHSSPQSLPISVTVTQDLGQAHSIPINNNTDHTVRELYTRLNGTLQWDPVTGTIPPLSTNVSLNVGAGPHDVQTHNGVDPNSYYSTTFINAEAISPLNINRPWPEVLTGWSNAQTWTGDGYFGVGGDYGRWTVTFYSDLDVNWRFDSSVTPGYSQAGTGSYGSPQFHGQTWSFTGFDVNMTYFWEGSTISMEYPYTAQLIPQ